MAMRLDAFDYHLPKSLIAQTPLEDRASSRLMVVNRATGRFEHATFRDLPSFLTPGDLLVVNRSRVVPARLFVRRSSGGRVELLVTRVLDDQHFVALANPMRRTRAGEMLSGENGAYSCSVVARESDREVLVEITSSQNVYDVLDTYGHVPLPPYILRPDAENDRDRYQTVFAEEKGSVAAPTAGLHFTEDLLSRVRSRGIDVCSVVLHVGLGTFLPLDDEVVENNKLHTESFSVSGATLDAVARTRASGRRVAAVGTTATRVLETVSRRGLLDGANAGVVDAPEPRRNGGRSRAEGPGAPREDIAGETDIFIYPGCEFGCVDKLITNFHLPQSSLLLLVCAFLGTEKTLACYEAAVRDKYRFYSYGDAMFIR
jgi:S-adenosylmethionine:tRNA ribosyltransferase-isomerase